MGVHPTGADVRRRVLGDRCRRRLHLGPPELHRRSRRGAQILNRYRSRAREHQRNRQRRCDGRLHVAERLQRAGLVHLQGHRPVGQLIKRRDGDDHRAAGYANLRRGDRRDSARRRAGHRHAQVLGSARHRTDICRARRSVSRQRECDQPDQRTAQLLPQSGFIGSDSFTYQAIDSGGASQPATASITVPPPPPRPIASIVGPARVTVGQPVKYNASVIDSIGTPNAFR